MAELTRRAWFDELSDEDKAFIKRLVLASGSLKEVAQSYGISYPTVRLRLDRLIDKIKFLDSRQEATEFERFLGLLCVEGRIDTATLHQVLDAHRKELEARQ